MGPTFSLVPVFLGDDVGPCADAIIAKNDSFFAFHYKKLQITNFRKLLLLSSIFKAFPDKTIYVKMLDEFWRITTNFDVLFLQFRNN